MERRNNSLDNGNRRMKDISIDVDPISHPKGTSKYNRDSRMKNGKPMKLLNQMLQRMKYTQLRQKSKSKVF